MDATGIDERKRALRDRVWRLQSAGVTPADAYGKIPAFQGAEAGAERLARLDVWQRAGTIKANPDYAQLPVRVHALQDGKIIYLAVPKMASLQPFLLLDPEALDVPAEEAASRRGGLRRT